MTKRKLTPEGQLKRLNDRVGGFVPREPIPPRPQAGWRQNVYIQTTTHGVFYTANFVDDVRFPDGVPTWATVNVGLNLAFDGLGFRGDPFDPENRQYSLMEDGLYRRENGGNWISVLTKAAAVVLVGANDAANCEFGHNGLNCNINREGWVGVVFHGQNVGPVQFKSSLLFSTDFGATWTEGIIEDWNMFRDRVFSLTVGAYKGSSEYDAGQVMYCGVGDSPRLFVSTDGGLTWAVGAIFGAAAYYCHILVDPSDQSRVFVGYGDGVATQRVMVSLDHGATVANYDTNASEETGYLWWAAYYHLSVAMDERKTVRVGAQVARAHIHTTRDDGGSWEEPTPQYSETVLGISLIQDSPDLLYLLRQLSGGIGDPPTSCHVVFASKDEGRTMYLKAGANACTIDTGGGDSIPYNCGGVRGILEIWTDRAEEEIEGYPTYHSLGQHHGSLTWPQIEEMVGSGDEEVAPGSHDILSAYHGDTLPAVVSRGSLIVGNLTPLWSELVVGAVAGDVLLSDTVDAAWGQLRSISVNDAAAGLIITQAGAGASLSLPSATTAAKGLILGGDVALFRSAANMLNTPDSLTVGGIVALSAGLVGAPSYTFTGDLDTGMWHPAANTLAWSTNAGERMRLISDGMLILTRDWAADTNTVRTVLILQRTYAGGAGADGIGARIDFYAETETAGVNAYIASIDARTTEAAEGIEDADLVWQTSLNGVVAEKMRLTSDGQLQLAIQGAAGGLLIGGDAQIYRSAANELLTPDRFVMDAQMTFGTATLVTIATVGVDGVITVTKSYHRVDTEGAAATDDLDIINGGVAGVWLILQTQDAGRDVTVKHGTGNIYLDGAADFTLTGRRDKVILFYDSVLAEWCGFGLNLV